MVREKEQLDARYLKFDVDQLCAIAASTGSKSPVRAIEKTENGFGKVLLITKEDGSELAAKLPFSYAGPPKYMTASEAAVLQYRISPVAKSRKLVASCSNVNSA